ncbi:M23 family metallopeptidase [Rhizobium leguminosarum]|uniref:M23 family metallopeptidase n=1 Tax=Rhizobium leguminosarum TaxID=384 RepID=UPI0013E32ABB|nr:M23 family metallopeptidase [Rhizobium leguminosarum]
MAHPVSAKPPAVSRASAVPGGCVDISGPASIAWVATAGSFLFSYELRLTNRSGESVRVDQLAVEHENGNQLALYSSSDLDRRLRIKVLERYQASGLDLAPGASAIVYVDVNAKAVGRRLRHRLRCRHFSSSSPAATELKIPISTDRPVVLAPPLRDGPWIAVHSSGWDKGHRRFIYVIDGLEYIPGRYAIDFVGVTATGQTTVGGPDDPLDAVGYGQPVLAGANAVVAAVRDGTEESRSVSANPAHGLSLGAGNYVALALGGNRFAFYEHLRPGSISVTVGERVRVGQVIGALGFSGDSTGPHLHLHVANGLDPVVSDGLPFVISRFREVGGYPDFTRLGRDVWAPDSSAELTRTAVWPGENVVVTF